MVVVISDLHIGNRFDKNKLETVKSIIAPADQVVLNGDLWIHTRVSFESFFHSQWAELFPLFQAKNTIYIHGNHDDEGTMDTRMNQFFQTITRNYVLSVGKFTYYFEHGHTRFWKLPLFLMESLFEKNEFLDYLDYKSTLKYGYPKNIVGKIFNEKYKRYAKKHMKENEFLVIGHTHQPEIDKQNHFINSGLVDYGKIHYLKLLEDGPELVMETYKDLRKDQYEN